MDNSQIDENPIRCKTILVGNSGVGKTSIISRYLGKFNPKEKTTIGASFTNKLEVVNDKKILFEIWDTAGQERYRSINNIFYQDAYICLLVYDITKKQTFDDIKEYWYKSVLDEATENIIFHIVGNKIDLIREEEVDRNEVKDYCDKIGVDVSFISAKEENSTYVDILFSQLAEKFINSEKYKELEKLFLKNQPKKLKIDDDTTQEKIVRKQKGCC
jgi:Ras-related protein Rab-11A